MTKDEAQQIIIEARAAFNSRTNTVLKGLLLLARFYGDLDLEIACEHDVLYCGLFGIVERMTREDVLELAELGWFEESGSWANYV